MSAFARHPSGSWGPRHYRTALAALGLSFRWDDDRGDGGFTLASAKNGHSAIDPVADDYTRTITSYAEGPMAECDGGGSWNGPEQRHLGPCHSKVLETILASFVVLLTSFGCSKSVDACEEYRNNASVYVDVVENVYLSISVKNGEYIILEGRDATDTSRNPVIGSLIFEDGALWFVGMALPIGPQKPLYKSKTSTCRLEQQTSSQSSFSCLHQDGEKTSYDLDRKRGLTAIRRFAPSRKLVSHSKLLSEEGAFVPLCPS